MRLPYDAPLIGILPLVLLGLGVGTFSERVYAEEPAEEPRAAATPAPALSPTPTPTPVKSTAQLIRGKSGNPVPGLQFKDTDLKVTLLPKNGKLRPSVEVRGSFNHPGWALWVGHSQLIPATHSEAQEFSMVAYLNARLSEIAWTARGPKGEAVKETILLVAPDAQEFRIDTHRFEFLFSAGYGLFHYFQTGLPKHDSRTALLKARLETTPWRSAYGLLAEAEITLLTMGAKPAGTAPQTVRADADFFYRGKPILSPRLHPQYFFGVHYVTMMENGSPYGFTNLIAPEIGARLVFERDNDTAWIGEIRYIPISSLITTAECEVNLVFGWSKTFTNSHRVEIDLGYSDLSYLPDPGSVVVNRLIALRLGYSI